MSDFVIDIIGWYGIVAVLLAFALTSWRIIPQGWSSNLLNLTGAIAIVIQTASRRVYQPAVLNSIWTLIALAAIIRLLRTKQHEDDTTAVRTIVVPIPVEEKVYGPDGGQPAHKIFHVAVLLSAILVAAHGVVRITWGQTTAIWVVGVHNYYGLFALAVLAALNCFFSQNQIAAISWGLSALEALCECGFLRLLPKSRFGTALSRRRERFILHWQTCQAHWHADAS